MVGAAANHRPLPHSGPCCRLMTRFFRPILPVLLGVVAMELALGAMGPLIGVQLVQRGPPTG